MDLHGGVVWVEAHPVQATVIGGVSIIALIWIFGGFRGGSSGDGRTSLAGAYYAAEAQQAVVGGQIQEANIAATRDTSIAGLEASAAMAIASTQAGAAIQINGQNTSSALSAVLSNNATAITVDAANNSAGIMQTLYGKLFPAEIAANKGGRVAFKTVDSTGAATMTAIGPNVGEGAFGQAGLNRGFTPNAARAMGYTSAEFSRMTGLPGW